MENKRRGSAHLSSIAVRPHNRRLLLQLLRSRGQMSRAELSKASGLSPAAVTNVVAELIESGLVRDLAPAAADTRPSRLGRPSSTVALAAEDHFVLAVQIGAGVLQVGVLDMASTVIASSLTDFDLPAAPESVLELAVAMLRRALAEAHVELSHVVGLGVGAAGLVDEAQRVNLSSQNLGWSDVPMADYFERALGVEVIVDHNVRAMAVGEARYGNGQDLESLVFVYIRSGVGAGLILGGREYRGGTHGAAEIGHMRVQPGGALCNCGGHGCLETVISDSVLIRRMVADGLLAETPAPNDRSWAGAFVDAVAAGDERALAVRDEIVSHTGSALLNIINLLNPELIVLGGLLNDLAPVILDELRRDIPQQVLPLLRDTIRIEPSAFGAEAGLIGAGTIALDRFVFGAPVVAAPRAS